MSLLEHLGANFYFSVQGGFVKDHESEMTVETSNPQSVVFCIR